ncbi:MAG: lytic transglycosylase domain-containing protein [Candidatus Binatia bacterium]
MVTNLLQPDRWSRPRAPVVIALLGFLSTEAVEAQVYVTRDAQGVHRFTSVPVPGSKPFDLGARDSSAPARAADDAYDDLIHELAGEHQLEPALVKAMIRAESRFDPGAVSRRGARGLMQLTPRIARHHGVRNLRDPRQNILGGVRHLRSLLDRFDNDTRLALAAYNAGPRAVVRHRGVPPYRETRAYVAKVLRFRQEYRRQGVELVRNT